MQGTKKKVDIITSQEPSSSHYHTFKRVIKTAPQSINEMNSICSSETNEFGSIYSLHYKKSTLKGHAVTAFL